MNVDNLISKRVSSCRAVNMGNLCTKPAKEKKRKSSKGGGEAVVKSIKTLNEDGRTVTPPDEPPYLPVLLEQDSGNEIEEDEVFDESKQSEQRVKRWLEKNEELSGKPKEEDEKEVNKVGLSENYEKKHSSSSVSKGDILNECKKDDSQIDKMDTKLNSEEAKIDEEEEDEKEVDKVGPSENYEKKHSSSSVNKGDNLDECKKDDSQIDKMNTKPNSEEAKIDEEKEEKKEKVNRIEEKLDTKMGERDNCEKEGDSPPTKVEPEQQPGDTKEGEQENKESFQTSDKSGSELEGDKSQEKTVKDNESETQINVIVSGVEEEGPSSPKFKQFPGFSSLQTKEEKAEHSDKSNIEETSISTPNKVRFIKKPKHLILKQTKSNESVGPESPKFKNLSAFLALQADTDSDSTELNTPQPLLVPTTMEKDNDTPTPPTTPHFKPNIPIQYSELKAEEEEVDEKKKKEDEEEMIYLRLQLKNQLDMFVLNNVCMSVQFFENFDAEIKPLREEMSQSEAEELEYDRFRHLQVDQLMEVVGQHVTYQPKHGPMKNKESLLHPIRSYVVYENVKVNMPVNLAPVNNGRHEGELQGPFYEVEAELEPNNKVLHDSGYVTLKEINTIKESKKPLVGEESDYTYIGYPFQNVRKSLMVPHDDAVSSTYNMWTPTICIPEGVDCPATSCELPNQCWTGVKVPIKDNARRFAPGVKIEETIMYLNSNKFFHNFLAVYDRHLRLPLGMESVQHEIAHGPRITVNTGKIIHQITPVLAADWWPKWIDDFMRIHKGEDNKPKWPLPYMKEAIRNRGVYLLPLGYLTGPTKSNPRAMAKFELQWKIITPWAERFLLLYTRHVHVRCYLFTIALYRTFFYQEAYSKSIDPTHISHFLFWELQKDFYSWSDHYLGEDLLQFLKKLLEVVMRKKIPDFFFRDRNILQSRQLFIPQQSLTSICSNPVPHLLIALKNLKMNENFFPVLDYTKMFKLLTFKNLATLMSHHAGKQQVVQTPIDLGDDERAIYRARRLNLKMEKQTQQTQTRVSVESIDTVSKIVKDVDDKLRRAGILEIFIKHFIQMISKFIEYKNFNDAHMYLDHVKRLNRLLKENDGDPTEFADSILIAGHNLKEKEKTDSSVS